MSGFWERLNSPRVSYRVYGPNKEFRRAIVHRFPIKGGDTLASLLVENITQNNTLLERLRNAAQHNAE